MAVFSAIVVVYALAGWVARQNPVLKFIFAFGDLTVPNGPSGRDSMELRS